jgi:hypothetical protein
MLFAFLYLFAGTIQGYSLAMIFISLIHLAREEKASLRGLKIMFL